MNYYNEIERYIKKNEINKKYHEIAASNEDLENKWHIGRLIVEAQGGSKRAKYGNELIKKWSVKLTIKYGKGFDSSNLKRFRLFYELFPKGGPLAHQLTWSHIQALLPIKDESKRNYYINQIIERNLSKRALIEAIKTSEYERLINKPDKIEIKQNENLITIDSNFKNPILINISKDKKIISEKDLENAILAQLQYFFSQLGKGFALIGNQVEIICDGKRQYIDILLFNIKFNCYVVVELKIREIKPQDKGQIESYMKVVDKEMKEAFHNKTIGIIISKKNNHFIAEFIKSSNIYALTYQIA